MSEWFISRDGKQVGPLTATDVSGMLAAGELKAGETLAWKEGMPDWKKLIESGVLSEASMSGIKRPDELATPSGVAKQATTPPQRNLSQPQSTITINPYTSPATSVATSDAFEAPLEYPGIGRLGYFLFQLAATVVVYGILFVALLSTSSSGSIDSAFGIIMVVAAIGGIVGFYIGVKRVQNLGMSGWAILWMMVPIMNIWIGWRMFACPPGYHDHKQLDTAGKVLTGVLIALFILAIGLNIVSIIFLQPSSY